MYNLPCLIHSIDLTEPSSSDYDVSAIASSPLVGTAGDEARIASDPRTSLLLRKRFGLNTNIHVPTLYYL